MQRTKGESGFVLAEAVATVVIVAVLFTGLMYALLTAWRVTDQNAELQRAGSALTSYAESLRQWDHYRPCEMPHPTTGPHPYTQMHEDQTGWQDPDGYSLEVVSGEVRFLAPDGSWTIACPPARNGPTPEDPGVQRLTIRATSDDGRFVREAQVVKREGRTEAET